MANQWFKLYGMEMMADPKYLRLSSSERSCWITLLCLASIDAGIIKNVEENYLMTHSGISPMSAEWTNTTGILLKLEVLGMITIVKDQNGVNCIKIKNWEKRQGAMTAYERVKKYRQNKGKTVNDNKMITDDNGQNRIEENRIEYKIPKADKSAKVGFNSQGAEVIKALEDIDPKNKGYYANKTQRGACDFLIQTYSLETVLEFVESYKNARGKIAYLPSITTPCELRDKWQKVLDAVGREKVQFMKTKRVIN